jgi:hypothetical protein
MSEIKTINELAEKLHQEKNLSIEEIGNLIEQCFKDVIFYNETNGFLTENLRNLKKSYVSELNELNHLRTELINKAVEYNEKIKAGEYVDKYLRDSVHKDITKVNLQIQSKQFEITEINEYVKKINIRIHNKKLENSIIIRLIAERYGDECLDDLRKEAKEVIKNRKLETIIEKIVS